MYFGSVELVEQHDSTRLSRRARHVQRVESCRDVTWRAKWKFGLYACWCSRFDYLTLWQC